MCSPSWTPPPRHLPPHTIPLGHPSAPAPSILHPASNLDWRFVSYMVLYMFQCHSPKSSHPLPLPQSPKDCSIHLCLFCCLTYRLIITIFLNSIYVTATAAAKLLQSCPTLQPHRQQPTRLVCLWDSPGRNTGVGCHCLLQCTKVKSESEVTQSCRFLATPWTAAFQAPPSIGLSRQEYWSGVPSPSPIGNTTTH